MTGETLRSAALKRQHAHRPSVNYDATCECCNAWPCPDRLFADAVVEALEEWARDDVNATQRSLP